MLQYSIPLHSWMELGSAGGGYPDHTSVHFTIYVLHVTRHTFTRIYLQYTILLYKRQSQRLSCDLEPA